MGIQDRATDARCKEFQKQEESALKAAFHWSAWSKKCLKEVIDQVEMLTACYSYGDGQLTLTDDACFALNKADCGNEKLIELLNTVTVPYLDVRISDMNGSILPNLWFEWIDASVDDQITDMKTAVQNMVLAIETRLEILAELSAGISQLEEQIAAAKAELAAGLLAFSNVVAEDESE